MLIFDRKDALIEGLSIFMEEEDNHDYSEDKRLIEADLILTHDVVLDRSDSTNDAQDAPTEHSSLWCHDKVINLHPPEHVRKYVERLRGIPPRLIYLNMIRDAGTSLLESVDVPLITRRQVHNLWASMTQSAWRRHDKDDYLSAQILLDETADYHLIEELPEPTVSLGFTTPFMHDRNLLILSEIKGIMVDATFPWL
ncbi:hypothetical protein V1525DRAFT_389602 [Lipomyces kononenkoae]|uniref:Uncharacterized protein n=1 Tax=Lipomyces kononenkoae TaxID=34357 RepID=A0ACC3SXB7_LIPKO